MQTVKVEVPEKKKLEENRSPGLLSTSVTSAKTCKHGCFLIIGFVLAVVVILLATFSHCKRYNLFKAAPVTERVRCDHNGWMIKAIVSNITQDLNDELVDVVVNCSDVKPEDYEALDFLKILPVLGAEDGNCTHNCTDTFI